MRHSNVKVAIFDVLDNADYPHPRLVRDATCQLFRVAHLAALLTELEPSSDGVATYPIPSSGGFIDYRNLGLVALIAFTKETAPHQGSLNHPKIIRAYLDYFCSKLFRKVRRQIFDGEMGRTVIRYGSGR